MLLRFAAVYSLKRFKADGESPFGLRSPAPFFLRKNAPDNAPTNYQSLRDFRVRLRLYQDILCRKALFLSDFWGRNMQIQGDTVRFSECDMPFVQKFGISAATEMVLDYKSVQPLPFLYDTYQAADFLRIGRRKLFYYWKNADSEYRTLTVRKKSGGVRQLFAPRDGLRALQIRILHGILQQLPVSKYATAYVRGSTLRANAAPHVGKRYLLKLDITDFFGSIRFAQVYSAAFHTRYFPKQIGVLFTALCCREEVLPQGAPTSPAISNLVMRNFDNALGNWCASRGIAYTRYCDDMTFSADVSLYAVYQKARAMLREMGFVLNERKTKFFTNTTRQSVTGLTVNEKVSVPADYKRELRQEVYYALKFGVADSILHADRTDFIENGVPNAERYAAHLIGRLRFVLQIEPQNIWAQKALRAMDSATTQLVCEPYGR